MLKYILLIFTISISPIHNNFAASCDNREESFPLARVPQLEFKPEDIKGLNAGFRPKEDGGFVTIGHKSQGSHNIIDNVGYGSAGITLSPGGAKEAVRIWGTDRRSTENKITVIGAGCAGLTTVEALINTGVAPYNITVYADQFPSTDFTLSEEAGFSQDSFKMPTSVGAGIWFPWTKGRSIELDHRLQCDSYEYYSRLIEAHTSGITLKDFYAMDPDMLPRNSGHISDSIREKLGTDTLNYVRLTCDDGGRQFKLSSRHTTLGIDGSIFYPNLLERLKGVGVNFVKGIVSSDGEKLFIQEEGESLAQIDETTIFNCSGYGTRALFEASDEYPKMYADLGCLLYVRRPPEFNMFIFGPGGDENTSVYPTKDGFAAIGDSHLRVDSKRLEVDPAYLSRKKLDLVSRAKILFESLGATYR